MRTHRTDAAGCAALEGLPDTPLGSLAYGEPPARQGAANLESVQARVLLGGGACVDTWCSPGPFTEGRQGSVRWRHNGHWLYGALELNEAPPEQALAALVQAAYDDVFATLRRTGFLHLQRLWNYLPRINADGHGLERYRQFNSGRQQAFLDAGQTVFAGAPAACALGTHQGPLCVRFLAGRMPPLALENPRQVSAYHYPAQYGQRSPVFSRAALLNAGGGQVALLISGTASIVGHASVHAGNVQRQARETLANLNALVAVANARSSARFAVSDLYFTVYVRHAEDAPVILQVMQNMLGEQAPSVQRAVFLEADICRIELLVEIEAHGFAPGELTG